MIYAKDTMVSVEKSKAEIESMLKRYGADKFLQGWSGNKAAIGFKAYGRNIRFELPLPDPSDPKLFAGRRALTDFRREELWEQACRQRWRALCLVIKAKLEAVSCGITTFEEEFYAHIVMPGGKTIYQQTRNNVELAYKTNKEMPLLGFDNGEK